MERINPQATHIALAGKAQAAVKRWFREHGHIRFPSLVANEANDVCMPRLVSQMKTMVLEELRKES